MAHIPIIGQAMITYVIDKDAGDIITPAGFVVRGIYWKNTGADTLILREYIADRVKADMPYLPILTILTQTHGLLPETNTRYLIDVSGSTITTSGTVVTLLGHFG